MWVSGLDWPDMRVNGFDGPDISVDGFVGPNVKMDEFDGALMFGCMVLMDLGYMDWSVHDLLS